MVGNMFNWFFNFLTSRTLSLEEFANLTFYVTFQYIISIFTGAVLITANKYTAIYKSEKVISNHNPIHILKNYSIILGIISSFIYILTANYWAPKFNFPSDSFFILSTSPMFLLMFIVSWYRGVINGLNLLVLSGWTMVVETSVKLLFAITSFLFSPSLFYLTLSVPISIGLTIIFIYYKTQSLKVLNPQFQDFKIPNDVIQFYIQTLLFQFGVVAIINIDILIVNRYLSPDMAGIYSLLSLIGKMLFFINYTLSALLVPIVSKRLASLEGSRKPFIIIMVITIGFSGIFSFLVVQFPETFVQILIGEKYKLITPYLLKYCVAISILSISLVFSTYYLLKQKYLISLTTVAVVMLELILMSIYNDSINTIVNTLLFTTSILTAMMLGITLTDKNQIAAIKSLLRYEKTYQR